MLKEQNGNIVELTKNYRLCYDKYCMWIEEHTKHKRKDGVVEDQWIKVAGYCKTFQQLFQDFVTYQMKKSDTKDAKLFIRDIARKEKALYAFIEKSCEKWEEEKE